MPERFKFIKKSLEDLGFGPPGERHICWDTDIPKLAIRVSSTAKTFYVVKRIGTEVTWIKLGVFPDMTAEQARRAALRELGDIARGLNPAAKRREENKKVTLGEAYEQYRLLHVEPRGIKSAEDMQAMWERCLGALSDAAPKKHGRKRVKHPAGVDWSRRKLESITNAEVRSLHAAIGRTHRTRANRLVEFGSSIYNRAIEWGYAGPNPFEGIEPFKETKRDRLILAGELPKFFSALAVDTSEDFKHFVLLSLLTGARRTNVLSMRWEDVDLQSATWRIAQTKNDEPQVVALVPKAVEVLQTRKSKKEGYVFPAPSKTGYMTPPKKRWRSLLKRAQLSDLRVHDLRRSLGSWQAINGASLALIGKSLGHKSADATMIYARLSLDPVRASLNAATTAMLEAAGVRNPAELLVWGQRRHTGSIPTAKSVMLEAAGVKKPAKVLPMRQRRRGE